MGEIGPEEGDRGLRGWRNVGLKGKLDIAVDLKIKEGLEVGVGDTDVSDGARLRRPWRTSGR